MSYYATNPYENPDAPDAQDYESIVEAEVFSLQAEATKTGESVLDVFLSWQWEYPRDLVAMIHDAVSELDDN